LPTKIEIIPIVFQKTFANNKNNLLLTSLTSCETAVSEMAVSEMKTKTKTFLAATHAFKGYSIENKGLSVEDM